MNTEDKVFIVVLIIVVSISFIAFGFGIYADGIEKTQKTYCKQIGDCVLESKAPIYHFKNRNNINFSDICYCKNDALSKLSEGGKK